jgi:hypothetical protein
MLLPPLPEHTYTIPIARLRLPDRIRNTLLRAHITTVGDLTTAFDTLLSIRGMGVSSVVVLEAALTSLHSSLTDDATVDWPMYWQLQELDPEDAEPDGPARTVIDFPEPVKQLSIGHLHLPRLAYLTLVRAEILSIGDLCEARNTTFFGVERIGTTLIEKIETALSHLMDAMGEDDEIDWPAYWQAMGITVIPENYRGHGADEQNTAALEDLIKAILTSAGDDRYWRILQRRFGLAKTKKLTLEELGDGLAITRERVRQIEQKCLVQLREVLIDNHYVGRSYHIHPTISTYIKSLIDTLALKASDLMLETDLFDLLQQSIPSTPRTNPLLHLLFTLTGLRRIEFDDPDLTPVWQRGATNVSERVQTIVSALDTLLTRDIAVPMEDFDILLRINKQLPKAQKLDLLEPPALPCPV